jgi:hypothetical protein
MRASTQNLTISATGSVAARIVAARVSVWMEPPSSTIVCLAESCRTLAGLSAPALAHYANVTLMFPRGFLIALFAASVATADAEQMLFEDTFGQSLPRNNGSRDAGHGWEGGTELRQSGPLAPVKYTHNGAEWRVQNQLNDLAKGVESRFFTLPDKWLLVGPAWELDSADGSYEVVFEFSPPDADSQTAGARKSARRRRPPRRPS